MACSKAVNFIAGCFDTQTCPVGNILNCKVKASLFVVWICCRCHFVKHTEYVGDTGLKVTDYKNLESAFLVVNTFTEKL